MSTVELLCTWRQNSHNFNGAPFFALNFCFLSCPSKQSQVPLRCWFRTRFPLVLVMADWLSHTLRVHRSGCPLVKFSHGFLSKWTEPLVQTVWSASRNSLFSRMKGLTGSKPWRPFQVKSSQAYSRAILLCSPPVQFHSYELCEIRCISQCSAHPFLRRAVIFIQSCCLSDINECTEGNFTCPNNSHCFNIDGSYRCRCNRGYQNIDDSCVGECLALEVVDPTTKAIYQWARVQRTQCSYLISMFL